MPQELPNGQIVQIIGSGPIAVLQVSITLPEPKKE